MQKFTTEKRPFESLVPGDRIVVPYGVATVFTIRWVHPDPAMTGEYVTVDLVGQESITSHKSNWPDVVTGFTPEYIASGSL